MRGDILTNRTAEDRSGTDFYPTPPDATKALMRWLGLPKATTIWECACGEGHMAKVIEAEGYRVYPTTLHDQGFGATGVDFTKQTVSRGNFIITNPPFKLSEDFIATASRMGVPFAFLLKSQYWHAAKRGKVFDSFRPRAVLPLRWRPDFLFGRKGGSPTMEVIWTVWNATPSNLTEYAPLNKAVF